MADRFDEKDMAEALDTYRIIADTGVFDLTNPEDQKILSKVSAMGAVIMRGPEEKPDDIDGFVEDNAPLVDKLTSKTLPSKGEQDGNNG